MRIFCFSKTEIDLYSEQVKCKIISTCWIRRLFIDINFLIFWIKVKEMLSCYSPPLLRSDVCEKRRTREVWYLEIQRKKNLSKRTKYNSVILWWVLSNKYWITFGFDNMRIFGVEKGGFSVFVHVKSWYRET